ncbi:hypothetical protein RRG08_029560 [Elysia crispata]|uniref:Uncharacterized protein n=1 Tax=Elysia crispata TaxID=231223 RepID=A0AAE1EGL2_9GAST|nr:hypothetical protein RRG08_029560 [Elysia crispata]
MVESLSPGQASLLRHEARLARILSLENEIWALQSQAVKQSSRDTRDVATLTILSKELLNKRQGSSAGGRTGGSGTAFPPGSADHKMMVLHQQQQQLQQQLLHHKQHHLPLSQSSYAPSSSHTPAVVNNTPAHSSRRPQQPHHYPQHYHHAPAVTSSSFSQPPQHSWQPQTSSSSAALPPNSRIVQYMQEVAIYAGVEPHATFHPNSSLTQSAPTSQSLALHSSQPAAEMYSNTLPASLPSSSTAADVYYQQQQQQALMERLGKSSASKAASLTSSGVAGQLHLSVDDDADDQPVNYSLKYQDVASSSSQPSPGLQYPGHMTSSNQGETTNSNVGTFRINPELLRASGLSSSFTDHAAVSASSSAGSMMVNPALVNSPLQHRRPVPNVIPNRFSTPPSNMYRSGGPPAGLQFMTPQGAAYPGRYPVSQRYPLPALSSSFASSHPTGHPAGSVQSRSFSLPSAHQHGNPLLSHSAVQASLTAYAETDLDLDDQPTDFSLRYSEEVAEDSSLVPVRAIRHDYHPPQEEQPINYSMRFQREETMSAKQQEQTQKPDGSGAPNCVECRYAEARRTNEQLDNSSNDDQVRTFCTEGTPYLSTATSLTDLAQVGKHDEDNEDDEEEEEREENTNPVGNGHDVRHLHQQHVQGCRHQAASAHKTAAAGTGMMTLLNDTGSSGAGNLTLVDPDRTLTPGDPEKSKGEVEMTASSSGSQTTDRHTGSTVVVAAVRAGSSLSSRADSHDAELQEAQQNFHSDANEGASDQTKRYYEEGTPTFFSRVSSLSSLHSSEARDNGDTQITKHPAGCEKVDLPCIVEADAAEPMLAPAREKKGVAVPAETCSGAYTAAGKTSSGPGSNLRRITEQGQRSDREAKTVTFDENHQVEETPLMFSRSSSPESLSSFDTQSVHSSVISEYSRRASQVVSPSEIPDSPSESMPSSPPRRAHSPTRRLAIREHLNNFSSTPKSTNVVAKQSLDVNRTPATLRSRTFYELCRV